LQLNNSRAGINDEERQRPERRFFARKFAFIGELSEDVDPVADPSDVD